MYKISISPDLTVQDIFDTDVYIDPTVTTYPITNDEFQLIYESTQMSLWQYKEGKVIKSEFSPEILKSQFNQKQKDKRVNLYQLSSDPVYMQWQRQEATQQEWLDEINRIKLMYPYEK